jgi:hypothetical protein
LYQGWSWHLLRVGFHVPCLTFPVILGLSLGNSISWNPDY